MTAPQAGGADSEPEHIVRAYWERIAARDDSAFDLVALDFRQHAAVPQGRDGLRRTAEIIDHDLGNPDLSVLRVIAAGDMVVIHMTLTGTHRASTMPLLLGVAVTGLPVTWEFMHLFRVENGLIAEHWACRDDLAVLVQIGAWPPTARPIADQP